MTFYVSKFQIVALLIMIVFLALVITGIVIAIKKMNHHMSNKIIENINNSNSNNSNNNNSNHRES